MTTTDEKRETLGFQTEVRQLLKLMIHSLYSNREIFLRELISNAADAADKLRFEALSAPDLYEGDAELQVHITFDAEDGSVTISDNGIGMSRDEVIANLGTIARSGTAEFLEALSGDQQKDAHLIGQFGVGFYSAFIVADRVTVDTRRAGQPATDAVRWESDGDGEFTVEPIERSERGTSVTLHLKEDAGEFADGARLRTLVRRYSDHIAIPVRMPAEGEDADGDETVNQATALWTRPRSEVTDDEYHEFYKHIAHDFDDPLIHSHNRVEGKREYVSLLYIPARAPFDLWQRDAAHGLRLYVQRVFILDDVAQFLPMYLRFVRGVIDSSDLPLNVSRELLQDNAHIEAMRGALTRRVLDMLKQLATDDKEKYARFWSEFGQVLKEGIAEDTANRDRIAALLRFASTRGDADAQDRSLDDYVQGMTGDQKSIWFLTAETATAARSSPHLEVFNKRGIEVLLLSDRIDEWVTGHLNEFDGKPLRDVTRGELELGDAIEAPADDADTQLKGLLKKMRKTLGDSVETVRLSRRLTDSPACLVTGEHDPGPQMRRIMEAMGQPMPAGKPALELNPGHKLVRRLDAETDDDRFEDLARVLFDQALLAQGGQLEDPAGYVRRLNRMLVETGNGEG